MDMKRLSIKHHSGLKLLLFVGLLAGSFIMNGCNNRKEQAEVLSIQPGVPPSLSPLQEKTLINLSEKEVAELNIQTFEAKRNFEKLKVSGPARISVAPGNAHVISAPIQGIVQKIHFSEGDFVNAGDVLFQIESIEFGNLMADYLRALASAEFEKSQMKRIEQLVEKRIAPQNDLDKMRSDFRRANTELVAARTKLLTVGLTPEAIDHLTQSEEFDPMLKITSPISGVIDRLELEPGIAVDIYDFMVRVIDNSKLLVSAYLSPAAGAMVKKGDLMELLIPDNEIDEKMLVIHAINPGLDPSSRSVIAHAVFDNSNDYLKPGQSIAVEIESRSTIELISIPLAAITYDGDAPIVFVKNSDNLFEKRIITISEMRNDVAIIESGLLAGEKVATTQVFSLKALMRYDLFSE
jgi:cobalt-zinc-cadmium efflux system membrane fusion protein